MIRETETLPTWDLSDLYSGVDDPKLDADMEISKQQAVDFERQYKGSIAVEDLSAAHMRAALDAYETLLCAEYKPQAFAMLHFSTNTQDPQRGALLQKTREFGSTAATHLVFFDLEIGQIPQATYDRIAAADQLTPYRHYLDQQRELAAHNLSESEEKILVETANARGQAFARLFTEIHGRTRYSLERDGQTRELNQEQLLSLRRHPAARRCGPREGHRPRVLSRRAQDPHCDSRGIRGPRGVQPAQFPHRHPRGTR